MIAGSAHRAKHIGTNPAGLGDMGVAYVRKQRKVHMVIITWGGNYTLGDAAKLKGAFVRMPNSHFYERVISGWIPTKGDD